MQQCHHKLTGIKWRVCSINGEPWVSYVCSNCTFHIHALGHILVSIPSLPRKLFSLMIATCEAKHVADVKVHSDQTT